MKEKLKKQIRDLKTTAGYVTEARRKSGEDLKLYNDKILELEKELTELNIRSPATKYFYSELEKSDLNRENCDYIDRLMVWCIYAYEAGQKFSADRAVIIDVFMTKTRKFRAIVNDRINPKYEVTVGGEEWESGKGLEYEKCILLKCERLLSDMCSELRSLQR